MMKLGSCAQKCWPDGPAVALAALLLHVCYIIHPCAAVSSSRSGKRQCSYGVCMYRSHGKTSSHGRRKQVGCCATYNTPCSGHHCSNKESCCSFRFVCWLKHCDISLTRNAAAALDMVADLSIVIFHTLSQQRQVVYNAWTSPHVTMTNAFAAVINRNMVVVVVVVTICNH